MKFWWINYKDARNIHYHKKDAKEYVYLLFLSRGYLPAKVFDGNKEQMKNINGLGKWIIE